MITTIEPILVHFFAPIGGGAVTQQMLWLPIAGKTGIILNVINQLSPKRPGRRTVHMQEGTLINRRHLVVELSASNTWHVNIPGLYGDLGHT